jgi:hypothetical protein
MAIPLCKVISPESLGRELSSFTFATAGLNTQLSTWIRSAGFAGRCSTSVRRYKTRRELSRLLSGKEGKTFGPVSTHDHSRYPESR